MSHEASSPEEINIDTDSNADCAVLDTPKQPAELQQVETIEEPEVYDGPTCSQCEAPMAPEQMVCRRCGFYPSMGITVELDDEWEAAMDGEASIEEPRTAMEEFFEAVPDWTWPLVGTNVGILAMCIAGKLLLPAEATLHEFWGVWQLVGGLAMVAILHVICFVRTASSDTSIGLFDLVVSPLKAWLKTIARLPERLWLVIGATNGIMLSLCAVVIVGGIHWERLWDWGIEAPTNTSLVEAIASAAGNGPVEGTLEESIEDFAGAAPERGEEAEAKKSNKPKEPLPRVKGDCLIIGFELNDTGQLAKLHLASEVTGRLLYAGHVEPDFEAEEAQELKRKLMRVRTGTPLVKTGKVATWVHPRFPCRVSYTVQARNGRMREMQLEEMLPELKLPW